jgi:transcriptional regulator with XRE-family HTH domain
MDNKKIGLFISGLRKDKNMTQKELADKLYVSDKAVSKWERGLAMPDIALIEKLSDCLAVNVSEILKGEKIDNMTKTGSDEIVKESIPFFQKEYFKKKIIKIALVIVAFLFLGYFAILCIGEVTYGTLRWKVFDGEYAIDLPSFSAKRDRKNAEHFLKALQNYDYDTIRIMLKPNRTEWYSKEDVEPISMDDYIANLEELKKEGFRIISYRFKYSYFSNPNYVCEFDITFAIGDFVHNITTQIQGYGEGVVVGGASMGSAVGKMFEY